MDSVVQCTVVRGPTPLVDASLGTHPITGETPISITYRVQRAWLTTCQSVCTHTRNLYARTYARTHARTYAQVLWCCTIGESTVNSYQYSDLGSNSCPSGCSPINDLQSCKDTLSSARSMNPAASQLGANTAGSGTGGNYGSGRPGGCFLHNPNKQIHFNTDLTGGSSHGNDYKICSCYDRTRHHVCTVGRVLLA